MHTRFAFSAVPGTTGAADAPTTSGRPALPAPRATRLGVLLTLTLATAWLSACGGDTSPPAPDTDELATGELTDDSTDVEPSPSDDTDTVPPVTDTDDTPIPDSPAEQCTDEAPDGMSTCAQQAAWGNCDEDWMEGFCAATCGTCEETPTTPAQNPTSQSNGSKWVGNITQANNVPQGFERYWNQITPENEGKWASVEPQRDQMNWWGLDRVYDFARQHGMPFKGHTFVWGQQSPDWMHGLSPTEQAEEVEEWIREFCQRYPDTEMIDVVNEPDHRTPSFINALGGAGASGHDWVIWSFEKARQHCPNSQLILNDYNVLRWDTDNFISIANKVKAAGLLDAIGCQAHGLEDQDIAELRRNLERIAAVGVDVYISEYDIDEPDDTRQRQIMEQQFTLFYESPSVVGITLWGYLYGQTWVPDSGLIRNGTPRPAMTWLMDYLGR